MDMGIDDSSKDSKGNTFWFGSRDEVVRFDGLIKSYLEDRKQQVLSYYQLAPAYDKLESRLFYSYFDIVISIIHLDNDLWTGAQIWNEKFSKKESARGSVLDSKDNFYGKMDIHRYHVSFVLRYRAIWDKIMGFLILLFFPEHYDTFAKADSRKKSFRTIAENHLDKWQYLPSIVKIIDGPLTKFDNDYRTPEAHFTGRLRKWSFMMLSWKDDQTFNLYGYRNLLNHVMIKIRELVDE
jgi:hypothetical protein